MRKGVVQTGIVGTHLPPGDAKRQGGVTSGNMFNRWGGDPVVGRKGKPQQEKTRGDRGGGISLNKFWNPSFEGDGGPQTRDEGERGKEKRGIIPHLAKGEGWTGHEERERD